MGFRNSQSVSPRKEILPPAKALRILRRRGAGHGFPPPGENGGNGGNDDPSGKTFFDDGTVKVTDKLLSIGDPWNKAFAIRAIESVHLLHNSVHSRRPNKQVAKALLCIASFFALSGLWAGFALCVGAGVYMLATTEKPDLPFSVVLNFGPEVEHLLTSDKVWAKKLKEALLRAMEQS